MKFEILVIRLLVAILEYLIYPRTGIYNKDRQNQFLMSDAIEWTNRQIENNQNPVPKEGDRHSRTAMTG